MRIWMDPDQAEQLFSLTPVDVSNAIAAQNVQIASGELGGLPNEPGAATQRHRDRTLAPAKAGGVRHDSAAGESRRVAGAPARRGAGRTRRRELFHRGKVQRRSRLGPGRQVGHRRQCARDGGKRACNDGEAEASFPARAACRFIRTTRRPSSRFPSRKWSRRSSSRSSWFSSSCTSSCKICGRR